MAVMFGNDVFFVSEELKEMSREEHRAEVLSRLKELMAEETERDIVPVVCGDAEGACEIVAVLADEYVVIEDKVVRKGVLDEEIVYAESGDKYRYGEIRNEQGKVTVGLYIAIKLLGRKTAGNLTEEEFKTFINGLPWRDAILLIIKQWAAS